MAKKQQTDSFGITFVMLAAPLRRENVKGSCSGFCCRIRNREAVLQLFCIRRHKVHLSNCICCTQISCPFHDNKILFMVSELNDLSLRVH